MIAAGSRDLAQCFTVMHIFVCLFIARYHTFFFFGANKCSFFAFLVVFHLRYCNM